MSNPQLSIPSPLDQHVKMFVQVTSSAFKMRIPPTVPLSDAFLQLFFHPNLDGNRKMSAAALISQMVFRDPERNIPIVVGLNGGQMMRAVIDAVNDPLTTPELQALSATAIGIIADKAPQMVCAVPNCVKVYVDLLASEDKGTSNIGGGLYIAQIESAVLLSRICSYGNGVGAKEVVKNDGARVICKRAVDWKLAPASSNLFRGLRACVASLTSLMRFGELAAVLKNGGLDTMSEIIASHGSAVNEALSLVLALTAEQQQREVLMKSGVCDVLVKNLSGYKDLNVQRKMIQIIGNLGTDQENMNVIAKTDVTVQVHDIMSMAEVDSPLWLQCIKCLLNLLVKEKTIKEFCENDGIVTVLEGFRQTKNPQAKEFLTYIIANILTIDDFIPAFIEEDGVMMMFPLLKDPSKNIAVNAARAVSNLCTTLDEPRVVILENDGIKTLCKALNRPELFRYALEISGSLALCTKKADSFKDEEFVKEVGKFLRASDPQLRGDSVKVFMNLARTAEMRRYIFQKDALTPIIALALKDTDKEIRYNSLRVLTSMAIEGRVRKWANEKGVVAEIKRMADSGALGPEIKSQSQTLLKNMSIAYESSYSDTDYKTLDITANLKKQTKKQAPPQYKKQSPSPVRKNVPVISKKTATTGVTKTAPGSPTPVRKMTAHTGSTVVSAKTPVTSPVHTAHKTTPVVHKVVPVVKKTTTTTATTTPTAHKPTTPSVVHKYAPTTTTTTTTTPTQKQTVHPIKKAYPGPTTTTTTTTTTTAKPPTPATSPVLKKQQPQPEPVIHKQPIAEKPKEEESKVSHGSLESSESSSSTSTTTCSSSSSSSSVVEQEIDESPSSISDSQSYIEDDDSVQDIPIMSETMQAELLEKQRAAVLQARLEEELAQERAEKEARRRKEEEARNAAEEARLKAEAEQRKKEAAERQRAEAERLQKIAEEEKKRIEEESKRKIDQIMSEAKHAREEEIQEQIQRENAEKEARKKEIEERKRLEEQRRLEEEARRREAEELEEKKKRREAERAARHERRRLEKERREREAAEAKRKEEEEKLRALEEEQRLARERDARIKEDARKKHIRRTYIVQEIYETEKNYVEGLTHMVNAYMQPLSERCRSRREEIITQQQIKLIFSNVEIILNYASTLLESLQSRMESWSETTCIGDIFLNITPFFASYIDYVNNYPAALETLNKLHSNERFQAFLEQAEKERPDLYLASVLVFPIQRIPRYILLLADLLKHTDKDHPDYMTLERALSTMQETGEHINERKRENESSTKMCFIQSSIKGKGTQVFVPGRLFVSEWNVGVVKKMGMAPRIGVAYIFSDSVFVARSLPKNKVLFKCLVPYTSLKMQTLEDSRNLTNGLKIINTAPAPKDKHSEWIITFNTVADRNSWLEGVTENSKQFEKRRSGIFSKH